MKQKPGLGENIPTTDKQAIELVQLCKMWGISRHDAIKIFEAAVIYAGTEASWADPLKGTGRTVKGEFER